MELSVEGGQNKFGRDKKLITVFSTLRSCVFGKYVLRGECEGWIGVLNKSGEGGRNKFERDEKLIAVFNTL